LNGKAGADGNKLILEPIKISYIQQNSTINDLSQG